MALNQGHRCMDFMQDSCLGDGATRHPNHLNTPSMAHTKPSAQRPSSPATPGTDPSRRDNVRHGSKSISGTMPYRNLYVSKRSSPLEVTAPTPTVSLLIIGSCRLALYSSSWAQIQSKRRGRRCKDVKDHMKVSTSEL